MTSSSGRSNQYPMTGVTKAVVCVILSGMMHIKEPLLLVHVAAAGFISPYMSGSLPYV